MFQNLLCLLTAACVAISLPSPCRAQSFAAERLPGEPAQITLANYSPTSEDGYVFGQHGEKAHFRVPKAPPTATAVQVTAVASSSVTLWGVENTGPIPFVTYTQTYTSALEITVQPTNRRQLPALVWALGFGHFYAGGATSPYDASLDLAGASGDAGDDGGCLGGFSHSELNTAPSVVNRFKQDAANDPGYVHLDFGCYAYSHAFTAREADGTQRGDWNYGHWRRAFAAQLVSLALLVSYF